MGTYCYGVVMEFMVLLSFFPLMLQYLYIQGAWEFLLYAGCCVVVAANLFIAFERWLSSQADIYGRAFWAVDSLLSLVPQFDCWCTLPGHWDHIIHRGCLGPLHLRPRRVFPPSCTSGRHSRFRSHKRYVNTDHGMWCGYKNFHCYWESRKQGSFGDDAPCEPKPPWFCFPLFFSSIWSRICDFC